MLGPPRCDCGLLAIWVYWPIPGSRMGYPELLGRPGATPRALGRDVCDARHSRAARAGVCRTRRDAGLVPAPLHPRSRIPSAHQLNRDTRAVENGGRISLPCRLAVLLSVTWGDGGMIAGYWAAGRSALIAPVDAALAIPRLFVILVLLVIGSASADALILVLGTKGWFATRRLVRGRVAASARGVRAGREGMGASRAVP